MTKTILLSLEVFDIDIMVVLGGTCKAALDSFCKKTGEQKIEIEENDRQRGWVYTYDRSGAPVLVWLHESASAETVAHEVVHAVYAILHNKQIPLTNETEEVYAYHIQWLFNKIAPKLPGWRIKKK